MNNLSLKHNNYFTKNNIQRKILKQKALENCLYVKKNLSEDHQHVLNDISLEMQKLLNQGKLNKHHFEKFVEIMQKHHIHASLCEEFLVNMLVVINHHTNSTTKTNWFGCVNKTNSLKIFMDIDSDKLSSINKNNFSAFIDLIYLANIYGIIGHKYQNVNYFVKAQNAYQDLINYYRTQDLKLNQMFKARFNYFSNEIEKYARNNLKPFI